MMIYDYRVRACLSINANSNRKVLRGPCSSNHNNKNTSVSLVHTDSRAGSGCTHAGHSNTH